MKKTEENVDGPKFKQPLLSKVYTVIGSIALVVGALTPAAMITVGSDALIIGIIAALVGVVCIGIAEVVSLIAKIEYNTHITAKNSAPVSENDGQI